MGFDVHQMVMPSSTGTTVVPLPHPYIGKLKKHLSSDVKINNHNAATKGSKSIHDDAMHLQLPGTISFNQQPNKEGEVSGGTAPKLKINGKEAAVIGSTVTTCNDVGARDNSTIIAPGVSMPMPVIINPLKSEEYEEERAEQETRKPEFTQVQWGSTQVSAGEEVTLLAQVQDIADGNGITFRIWQDGQDPAAGIPQQEVSSAVDGGSAEAVFSYVNRQQGERAAEDPKYFFTAHSAWCPLKKSSNTLTVALKRPALSNPAWQDLDGNRTDTGLVGVGLKLAVTGNADLADGTGVSFQVYPDGADPEQDTPVGTLGAEYQDGTARAEWTPVDIREVGATAELKYFFTATSQKAKRIQSGIITVKHPQIIEMKWEPETVYQGDEVKLIIKTFETAAFSPQVTIWIEEQKDMKPASFIMEHEATIDKDEIEVLVKIEHHQDAMYGYHKESSYRLQAKVVCETLPIKHGTSTWLRIETGELYE
jgi:hypothetical protein